ncbi:kinase-like domain-containing protein [Gorgonomyces haynaldii]|nr:kinase-like domain-containing protein [Gorgonomyces haynaldii]
MSSLLSKFKQATTRSTDNSAPNSPKPALKSKDGHPDISSLSLGQSSKQVAPAPNTEKPVEKKKYGLKDLTIDRTLGTGSFGRVHLVRAKDSGKFWAMKVLRKADVIKMRQLEHTINERAILARLDHPFLVSMLGTFQDSENVYFVLEYIQGGELFSYLRKSQRFPNNVARFYAAEVILAFEHLHSKKIIYRDLKPENLLLTASGHIKITDFGFAKVVEKETWTLCGTPDYLAPEIIQSNGYGPAVDWWALGVLIYEMVAGYPPFYHEDPMKLYENIIQCKPRFSSSFDPNCKDLVKRLLTPDLSKRFGNLKDGVEDIKRHKWFQGLEWDKLLRLEIPAPYIPPSKGEGDTSNFDVYPEDYPPYGATGPDPFAEKFRDF